MSAKFCSKRTTFDRPKFVDPITATIGPYFKRSMVHLLIPNLFTRTINDTNVNIKTCRIVIRQ